MRKNGLPVTVGCLLFLTITYIHDLALANGSVEVIKYDTISRFELAEGDRVVLLGNALIENEQQYGYLELALTTRWPDCAVTFRNLGWSGDNVFGDARSYFTSPPTAYELLLEQLTKARPTVVFVAYGANEAYEGEAGLPHFQQGLNQLLDKIDSLGARTVLLSPVPQLMANSPVGELSARNENLKLYSAAIASIAAERDKHFIDIFNPLQQMSQRVSLTTDGVHLNETGYYYLAQAIEKGLELSPRSWSVTIDLAREDIQTTGAATVSDAVMGREHLKFILKEAFLPLPLPEEAPATALAAHQLSVKGLKKGYYTLTVNGQQVVSASARQWAEGVAISQGPPLSQASELRECMLKKNELFFQQYRPLNRTYLTGFRSYEQGRHVEGLQQLDLLILWLEEQMASIRSPKSNVYQLTPIK